MYYDISMHINFEAEKNRKALIYTLSICGALLLLFFWIKWPINQIPPPPPIQDLIEVNLGNEFEGMGDEQPLIKGERAPSQDPMPQPQNTTAAASDDAAKDIDTDDNANDDAAPVTKVEKNNSKKLDAPKENVTKPVKSNNPSTVATPAPPKPQKPKYAYNGPGNGKGNGADQDNGYTNQGNNPNGKGDDGVPDGKPDSYGNNPGGKSGVSVVKGARPLNFGSLKLEDDFNQNAKVTLDIKYNSAGNFISSSVSKPTTTSSNSILSIAKREAAKLKFPSTADGGTTTILFNFKVQN